MKVEGVVFIPHTPQSELRKNLQTWEDNFSKLTNKPRVKFVEKGGTKLKDMICKSNPWSNIDCERDTCPTCANQDEKQRGRCQQEGICYSFSCMGCQEIGE